MEENGNIRKKSKSKKKREKEVREIEIDPELLRAIKELMEKTGELPISSAPDPKEQDKNRDNLLEELPKKMHEEALKKKHEKKSNFSCCHSDQKVSDPEFQTLPDVTPTSEYIVCIYL